MMRERRDILKLWRQATPAVLVTLVRVEGSSYRRTGARVLIAADGQSAGSISGGCLEAEVVRKAQWLVRNGAVVERYSTLFDDTAEIPYGLGCGGTVDLLLEPANTPQFEAIMQALESTLEGHTAHVTTQLPTPTQTLRREVTFSPAPSTDLSSRPESALYADGAERPAFGPADTFTETLHPPQRLILCGAGDDARPMVQMAALLGWNVTVLDGRPQMARPERFPEAQEVLTVDATQPWALDAGPWTLASTDAIVIMTHSYEQDRAFLAQALPARPRYLGLLGARHRSALLISEVAALLGWPLADACESIFAPVGMDLGGDGAEAIALATIAEIHACCEGKLRRSPRLTEQIIAEQIEAGGASRYLQAACAL